MILIPTGSRVRYSNPDGTHMVPDGAVGTVIGEAFGYIRVKFDEPTRKSSAPNGSWAAQPKYLAVIYNAEDPT
jgi:hypothetical protein